METRKIINSVIRSVSDFNLLDMNKKWSAKVPGRIATKFNRLKMEYMRSRTDQKSIKTESGFNRLKISI